MTRRVVIFSVLVIAIFLVFRFCSNKPEPVKEEEQKPAPLSISQKSAPFNHSYASLMATYYSLKNAFSSADISKVNSAANELAQQADSLHVNEIDGDSSIRETAKYFASTISASAKAIGSENSTDGKLNDFNMITDALWSLTRTVQYDGQKVYYHFCAAALGNNGGYWLSDKIDKENPYGSKLSCGEVRDSIDYSKK